MTILILIMLRDKAPLHDSLTALNVLRNVMVKSRKVRLSTLLFGALTALITF